MRARHTVRRHGGHECLRLHQDAVAAAVDPLDQEIGQAERLAPGRPGKPQKVFANETVRDTPPGAVGSRTFTIYDAAKPDAPLHTGTFPVPPAGENVLFVLKADGKGGLHIETVRAPAAGAKSGPKR